MTSTARTVLVFVAFVLCAAGVAAGVASIPAPGERAAAPAVEFHRIDAIPAAPLAAPATDPAGGSTADPLVDVDVAFLTDLFGPATGYTPEQAAELVLAAHRVCEGSTAGVPVVDMATVLTVDHGLTDDEARAFIAAAADAYCVPAV
jgi:hypothetical protein